MHRDLEPANILPAAGGCVKVADFGLAKVMAQAAKEGLSLAYSPDGRLLAAGDGEGEGEALLWTLPDPAARDLPRAHGLGAPHRLLARRPARRLREQGCDPKDMARALRSGE